jgi:hypothetical protein
MESAVASIPEIEVGNVTETHAGMPLRGYDKQEPEIETELDPDQHSPEVIAAYQRIMEVAEEDPNAYSYDDDEKKDL